MCNIGRHRGSQPESRVCWRVLALILTMHGSHPSGPADGHPHPRKECEQMGSGPFTLACFLPPPCPTLFPKPSYLAGVFSAFRVHVPFLGNSCLSTPPL